MCFAQVIFDKNDFDFEAEAKQLMEVMGENQEECIVALYDCNRDANKAINILLEGNSGTTSWETVGGKKKNFGKESSENKENREKRSEREANHGHGNKEKGRGSNRGREFKREENGIDCNQEDKTSDRRGKCQKSTLLKLPNGRALAKSLFLQILNATVQWHQGLAAPLLPPPTLLSSVLGPGFEELTPSKLANITSSQVLDLKAPSLGQFTTTSSS
ncbi:Ubiquitin-associated protein 2 [Heterocephalus glaber]|uniref:Ubiquitin-associated protein 2 n=1 Tax=Heterocephalus glaber TaxID=10181 RepID=G5ARN7_HETGA|nr:Ubiquitin-associated protein 2 [Heterocephalus glaber]